MLGETYDIEPSENGRDYTFTSIGPKGIIEKMILFQWLNRNSFNLAFGDIHNGQINDEVVSNNHDFVKVLGTVAKCAYHFVEHNPGAKLRVTPVDDGRKMLYNAVFRRHHTTIAERFDIRGRLNGVLEPYMPEKLCDEFELKHKI